jgi:hypothetical protein
MNDEEVKQNTTPSNTVPSVRPSTYEMLVRQSKKLGRGATTASEAVRSILNQEIHLPTAEQVKSNLSQRILTKDIQDIKQRELENANRLKKVVKKSHQVLASARTVFPMTLFPDSIIVDRTKISIIKRDFFWTSNVISFQIEDLLNVSCAVGPVFGSLSIASRVMSTVDHFNINYLWRGDALFIKSLIQGHIIAKNNKLETDHLSRQETIDTLLELGTDSDR